MTQKEDWNYSVQELLQKYNVTEQGLNDMCSSFLLMYLS